MMQTGFLQWHIHMMQHTCKSLDVECRTGMKICEPQKWLQIIQFVSRQETQNQLGSSEGWTYLLCSLELQVSSCWRPSDKNLGVGYSMFTFTCPIHHIHRGKAICPCSNVELRLIEVLFADREMKNNIHMLSIHGIAWDIQAWNLSLDGLVGSAIISVSCWRLARDD